MRADEILRKKGLRELGSNRAIETGWGTSNYNCDKSTLACTRTVFLYGAGGGVSCLFSRPSYQSGLTITAGSTTQCSGFAGRAVPDIAAVGDPNAGYLIGQTQTFPTTCNGPGGASYDEFRIGGTSLSCPLIAGIMALSDQKAGFAHGFANPFFYANPGKFTDILPVKTAVARRNFVAIPGTAITIDDCNGTANDHCAVWAKRFGNAAAL